MFGANFQRKYALTDQGVQNTKKGTFWTVIVNLVVMGGVGILYLVMSGLMETLTDGTALPQLCRCWPALRRLHFSPFSPISSSTRPPTVWCMVKSRPPGCVWRSGCVSCHSAFSASGIWPI